MRRIDELKKEIIHEILNSEEYKEYRRLQAEMDRTPDLKRQVDEFRMKNFELQNAYLSFLGFTMGYDTGLFMDLAAAR